MHIVAKGVDGQIVVLEMYDSLIEEIIDNVKLELYKTTGILPEEQRLLLVGKNQFPEEQRIPSYTLYMLQYRDTQVFVKFVPDERLALRQQDFIQQDKFQYYKEIFGKFATEKYIRLELGSCETVKDVKEKIEDMEHIPCDVQKLMFHGKDLHNGNDKLADYGIKGGCVLELSLGGQLFPMPVEGSETFESLTLISGWSGLKSLSVFNP